MFATGPANNCALEMYGTDSYGEIRTFNGMENIRTLEAMIDLEFLDISSSAANQIFFGEATSFSMDLDYNGAVATPMSGLRAVVNRGSAKTATPSDTAPLFRKRITYWLKDNQETVTFRSNGASGTDVTYTTSESPVTIVSPTNSTLLKIGRGANSVYQMRLYEAAIRVNGTTVFHVRPRLWMADSATPETVPDLSGYGNDLHVYGTFGSTFRYIPSWSRQVPYSGKETAG